VPKIVSERCELVKLRDINCSIPVFLRHCINLLECKGNYSVVWNNMKLVYWPWPLMGGWYSEDRTGLGFSLPRPLLTVPNITANVLIIILLYKVTLLCSFNVAIKGSK